MKVFDDSVNNFPQGTSKNDFSQVAVTAFGHLWRGVSTLPKKVLDFALQILDWVQRNFISKEVEASSRFGKSESRKQLTELLGRTLSQTRDLGGLGQDEPPGDEVFGDTLEGMGFAFSGLNEIKLEEESSPKDAALTLIGTEFQYMDMDEKGFLELLYHFEVVYEKLSDFPDLLYKLDTKWREVKGEFSSYMANIILYETEGVVGIRVKPSVHFSQNNTESIRDRLTSLAQVREIPVLLFRPHEEEVVSCDEQTGLQYHHSLDAAALIYFDQKGNRLNTILRNTEVSPGNSKVN